MKSVCQSVSDTDNGINIKDFLIKRMGFSATLVKRVKYGGVFVNGENVHMRRTLFAGDSVDVVLPDETGGEAVPIDIPLSIVYEDEFLLAVNKPAGMPTHPSRGNKLPTLAFALRNIHNPTDYVSLAKAKRRLIFDELLELQLMLFHIKNSVNTDYNAQKYL